MNNINLFSINDDIRNKSILISGCNGKAFGVYLLLRDNGLGDNIIGFTSYNYEEESFHELPVIHISQITQLSQITPLSNVVVIICDEFWNIVYDYLVTIPDINLIIGYAGWNKAGNRCIICDSARTIKGRGVFRPFLQERVFEGREQPTAIIHCPDCGFTYSEYRPDDEEMGRLYSNYRDEFYQKQRFKYEPNYTIELNNQLTNPEDGGLSRRNAIVDFIKDSVDMEACANVLDFGGDRGQFIPEVFEKSNKYVYDISGVSVIDGVTLIPEYEQVTKYDWDFIMCNMVLEHLSDVDGYFNNLVSIMNDKTYLYVEVPSEMDTLSTEFTLIHEHINTFRPETLKKLAGIFHVRLVKCEETDCIRALFSK